MFPDEYPDDSVVGVLWVKTLDAVEIGLEESDEDWDLLLSGFTQGISPRKGGGRLHHTAPQGPRNTQRKLGPQG